MSGGMDDLLKQLNQMQTMAAEVTTSNQAKSQEMTKKVKNQRRKSKDLGELALGFDVDDAKEIRERFDQYDLDKSGDIDVDELKEAIKGIKGVMSSSLTDRMFKNMIDRFADTPKDKYPKTGLSLTAFQKLVKDLRQPEDWSSKYDKEPEELLEELFKVVDTDGSGMITVLELTEGLRMATHGANLDANMVTTLQKNFGKDKDGNPTMENGSPAFSKEAFFKMVKAIKAGTWDKEGLWAPPAAGAPSA